jgi:predicted RNA-binding protein (virulence factor B family)
VEIITEQDVQMFIDDQQGQIIIHGTQKGSTWNQKQFIKGFFYGDRQRRLLGSR